MRTIRQINQRPDEPCAFEANEATVRPPMMRIARLTAANLNSEPDRRLDRIDALKILIRSLLDQLDYLTEPGVSGDEPDLSLQALVRRFEAEIIRQALMRTGGKQRQAARLLGEKKTTLNAKIMRYGIRVETRDAQSTNAGSVTELRPRIFRDRS